MKMSKRSEEHTNRMGETETIVRESRGRDGTRRRCIQRRTGKRNERGGNGGRRVSTRRTGGLSGQHYASCFSSLAATARLSSTAAGAGASASSAAGAGAADVSST